MGRERRAALEHRIDALLRGRLHQLRRASGLPIVLCGSTSRGVDGQRLTISGLLGTLGHSLADLEIRTGALGLGLQLSTLSTKITDLTFEEYQAKQIAEYRAAHRTATGRDGTVSVGRVILPLRRAAVPAARPSEATGWGASGVGVGVGVTGIRSGVRAVARTW